MKSKLNDKDVVHLKDELDNNEIKDLEKGQSILESGENKILNEFHNYHTQVIMERFKCNWKICNLKFYQPATI